MTFCQRVLVITLDFEYTDVVYQDTDFGGASREFTSDVFNLKREGVDRISSIKVFGSVWKAYEARDESHDAPVFLAEGDEITPDEPERMFILEEGEHSHWDKWAGSRDQLSTIVMINPNNFGLTPSIEVYEHEDFEGRKMGIEHAVNDLKYYSFNKISSVKVLTGVWVMYEHADFKGRQYIVQSIARSWKEWDGVNDQISSMRPVKEPAFNTEVLSMTFDIASGLLNATPVALVNLSQNNNTSVNQTATWSTTKTVTTMKSHAWHWENSTAVKAETTLKVGVPVIADGQLKMGVENTFSIGENRGSDNTQQDEWSFNLPETVKSMTRLQVRVNIQEGKIDVPFKAVLKRGTRVWEEQGTYHGTQSFNLHADYNETAL